MARIPFTLLEMCNDLDFGSTKEEVTRNEADVVVQGLVELAKVSPMHAINSAFVLSKVVSGFDFCVMDALMEKVVFPNLHHVLDTDLNKLRDTTAQTVSYAASLFDSVVYEDKHHASMIKALVPLFQALSKTRGQEGQTRELADFFVGKFIGNDYGQFEGENPMHALSDIMPFTTTGQLVAFGNQAARKAPKNRR